MKFPAEEHRGGLNVERFPHQDKFASEDELSIISLCEVSSNEVNQLFSNWRGKPISCVAGIAAAISALPDDPLQRTLTDHERSLDADRIL